MTKKIITAAITAVLTIGLSQTSAFAHSAADAPPDMEKCFGISKAHQNDCGTPTHGCASEQKIDADKNEWLLVPKGLCSKIVGGNLEPKNKA